MPEMSTFWDRLMTEQGVVYADDVPTPQSPYNVGDIIMGEIVEEEG